jgi:NADH-quinone oxidoreductase subunit G
MMADLRVLDAIATEMGHRLGLPDADAARRELDAAGSAPGSSDVPDRGSAAPTALGAGTAVLAGWRMLLDAGRMQDGETDLAGTARTPVARLSPATAADTGVSDGEPLTVSTDSGSITLPLRVTAMPDHVVWLPWNSAPSRVSATLHVAPGAAVRLSAGAPS